MGTSSAHSLTDVPYLATQTGTYWLRRGRDGDTQVPLSNFSARIVADVVRDDGLERQRMLELEVTLAGQTIRLPPQRVQRSYRS